MNIAGFLKVLSHGADAVSYAAKEAAVRNMEDILLGRTGTGDFDFYEPVTVRRLKRTDDRIITVCMGLLILLVLFEGYGLYRDHGVGMAAVFCGLLSLPAVLMAAVYLWVMRKGGSIELTDRSTLTVKGREYRSSDIKKAVLTKGGKLTIFTEQGGSLPKMTVEAENINALCAWLAVNHVKAELKNNKAQAAVGLILLAAALAVWAADRLGLL